MTTRRKRERQEQRAAEWIRDVLAPAWVLSGNIVSGGGELIFAICFLLTTVIAGIAFVPIRIVLEIVKVFHWRRK